MTTAKLAISAIRAVRPEAIIIAPALGHTMGETVLDMAFPEACLKDGLLPLIDAVSIHPYVDPEVVAQSYAEVQAVIGRFNPDGRRVVVLSTEWGACDQQICQRRSASRLFPQGGVYVPARHDDTVAGDAVQRPDCVRASGFRADLWGGGRQLIAAWTAGEAREAGVNGATVC